jgi:hypothetical protein
MMNDSDRRGSGVRSKGLARLGAFVVGALLGTVLVAVAPPTPADAITGSEFNAGLIIADSLFYDGNSMSEGEIQQFLAAKGSGLAGMTFSVGSRGRVISRSTGNVRCEAFTGGTLSAATIIFRAQQSCGISAKVLLVTLQKEQGLITKAAPSQGALDRAMGYACPDTAPCAPTTLGFGNQVYSGALQLNTYRADAFGRQPGWHAIQYHPNAGCGTSAVFVQNYATAALYNYTPYQPNAAALANLTGTGDSCSSYGNRNFWQFYNSWFGSTLGTSEPWPVIPPSVAGSSAIGATLTAVPGSWTAAPSFSYAWLRCTSLPATPFESVPSACTALPGASGATYATTSADASKYLAILVTATNSFGTKVSGGAMTRAVGTPENVTPPTVSGTPTLGSTWTVDTGTWSGTPTPTTVVYWLRCAQPITVPYTVVPVGCAAIPGANSHTYVSKADDVGSYLTAQVAGTNALGFALGGAVSTIPVGYPYNASAPTVSGSPAVGSTWTRDVGSWTGTPAPTTVTYWLRCTEPVTVTYTTVPPGCAAIPGANGASYVSTLQDVGKYLTAQLAGSNSLGFSLAGAVNTTAVQSAMPANTVKPSVSGGASVGSTWTVNPGTWTGAPAPTIGIYWLRCAQPVTAFTTVPTGCTAISGANAASYVATSEDAGKFLTAQVAGTNALGFALAGAPNAVAIPSAVPTNTTVPTVAGLSTVGSTWTVNTGAWSGSPVPTIGIYWLRCGQPVSVFTTVPSGCTAISGANATTYVATSADAGKYLTAQLAGSNALGFALAGAANSVAIQAAIPANTVAPTVSGAADIGSTWTVNTGTWTGSPAPTIGIYWLRCAQPITAMYTTVPAGCSAIPGANATTYRSTELDLGKYLTAQLAGSNPSGFALAGATNTTAVKAVFPANTVAPTVSGGSTVGSTWTVDTGAWTGTPAPTIGIYWLRCTQPIAAVFTTVPAGCTAISGANAASYVSTSQDVGKYLTAQLAGTNAAGFALAGAVSTTAVKVP